MTAANHLLPPDEPARLQALRALDLPAALAEPLFQQLVDLAAQVFHLPISFLSVVESAHVDFVLTHGMPLLAGAPREQTLCALPVRQADTFVIDDVRTGAVSVHQQVANQLGLVFYAGTPLLVRGELAIGALCVSDTHRRQFSELEQRVLETLAALISRAFEARQQAQQQPDGPRRWAQQQAQAGQQISSLEALLRHLRDREAHGPATPAVLEVVRRRLADVLDQLPGSN